MALRRAVRAASLSSLNNLSKNIFTSMGRHSVTGFFSSPTICPTWPVCPGLNLETAGFAPNSLAFFPEESADCGLLNPVAEAGRANGPSCLVLSEAVLREREMGEGARECRLLVLLVATAPPVLPN
eukprot:CAMPEP_0114165012 /NCGR_PEP_ID=MMETSP0043_2-20121206/31002_1 /TAXON_ID=464988 /ORGANISM="Hemiselmis andersenii, Strain CCMP644" /LENGTH=125 /DNA_ID=CAMNT_0001261767 /DNA_START=176 /DNA_END=550 /DNA_ORIENTATION=-